MSFKNSISNDLVSELIHLIQENKQRVAVQVNSAITLTYWQIGYKINHHILGNERAEYGEELVKNISKKLVEQFGDSFTARNLRRMIRFSSVFQDFTIVTTLSTQLSWSYFLELMQIKDSDKRQYYIQKIKEENWSVRETRRQIERKSFERSFIIAA